MNEQTNLFDIEDADPFVAALEKYGTWPVTVWEHDYADAKYQQIKQLIGDTGEDRVKVFSGGSAKATSDASVYRGKVWGVFSPSISAWILNMYAPKSGVCFDPFGGGGTRAIMAAKHGMDYSGVELRLEECVAVESRCAAANCLDKVKIVCGDSTDCSHMTDNSADFLLTCPPYWNLEQYNGGDNDLSMCRTYGEFCSGIGDVIAETKRILKPGAIAVWVVGIFRHNNELIPMHHDITRMHIEKGFSLREEIILAHRNNGALQRVGNFEKGNKYLIRTHEYALVFNV